MFRFAVCSEIFQGWSFADAVKAAVRAGFGGMELASFTLGEDPTEAEPAKRREYRATLESEGLRYVGLHWLLTAPKPLHVTTPDRAQREWSWNYVRKLMDLSADLGPAGVMVFGSPRQRSAIGGLSPEEATRYFVEGLAGVADHAGEGDDRAGGRVAHRRLVCGDVERLVGEGAVDGHGRLPAVNGRGRNPTRSPG